MRQVFFLTFLLAPSILCGADDPDGACQTLRQLYHEFTTVSYHLDFLTQREKLARSLLTESGSRSDLVSCAHWGLGFVAAQRHDYDEAWNQLRMTLELDPSNMDATRVLAGVFAKRGNLVIWLHRCIFGRGSWLMTVPDR